MSTVKFEATVENGSIVVPVEFRNRVKGKVEVVISTKEIVSRQEDKNYLREMIEDPTHDPDFVPLTQDEVYDRNNNRAENFIHWLIKNPLKVDKSIAFLTRDEIYDRKL
jgi:bifunctional DNA-binding transcriptional regulator/antitoxin component of YhaV-PrlF toxin-antitoxin module